jgi:hypothetical protein
MPEKSLLARPEQASRGKLKKKLATNADSSEKNSFRKADLKMVPFPPLTDN